MPYILYENKLLSINDMYSTRVEVISLKTGKLFWVSNDELISTKNFLLE